MRNEPVMVQVQTVPPLIEQDISLTLMAPPSDADDIVLGKSKDFFGLSGVQLLWLTPEQQEVEIALAAAAGAEAINLDFDWQKIEPGPDKYNWNETDKVFALANRYKLRLVPILLYTPQWSSSSAFAPLDYRHAPPSDINDFKDFVYTVVSRYKPTRENAFGIRDWVIWNEPNVNSSPQKPMPGNFWSGSLEEYITLLRAGYEGAHAADPNCNVLNGGLADVYWEDGEADLATALKRLYDPDEDGDISDGGRAYFDTLNIHIYQPGDPDVDWYKTRLESVTGVMKYYGDEDKSVWITETGFGSEETTSLDSQYLDEETQANAVRFIYETTAAYAQVERVFWWSLRDYYHDSSPWNKEMEAHYGLLRANFTPKPAYLAYGRVTNHLGDKYEFNARTNTEGTANVILPAEFIRQPGYYVLFASTNLLPETAVMVYTVKP